MPLGLEIRNRKRRWHSETFFAYPNADRESVLGEWRLHPLSKLQDSVLNVFLDGVVEEPARSGSKPGI
jgi:hypothetical protein